MLLDLRLQIGPNGQNDTVHVLSDTLGGRAEASMLMRTFAHCLSSVYSA